VFLAGSLAYKLKHAVRFDYLDFSTLERRRALCDAEGSLNRRSAHTLYRGVVAVIREADGSLALGGTGDALDWVIVMNRFSQEPFRPSCCNGAAGSGSNAACGRSDRRISLCSRVAGRSGWLG
jgi:aminoglycoside phosphotransferase family enzyme